MSLHMQLNYMQQGSIYSYLACTHLLTFLPETVTFSYPGPGKIRSIQNTRSLLRCPLLQQPATEPQIISDKLLSFSKTRKEDTVPNRLHIGHS